MRASLPRNLLASGFEPIPKTTGERDLLKGLNFMPFCAEKIENLIEDMLRRKLASYNPKNEYKPFHDNLLGKNKMILFSFIHSISTSMGMSVYESVAAEIANDNFETIQCQKKLNGCFTELAQKEINQIRNELSDKHVLASHAAEEKRIRSVCQTGKVVKKNLSRIDLYLEKRGCCFAIDIKTAKPNIDLFEKQKEKMLEWMASVLYESPQKNIRTIIAIPYNPSYPNAYDHWTLRGVVDTSKAGQLLVAQDFWNFIAGGEDIYDQLLECFFNVGRSMEWEIDQFIQERLNTNMIGRN